MAPRRERGANHSLRPISGKHNFARAGHSRASGRCDSELIGQLNQVRAVHARVGPHWSLRSFLGGSGRAVADWKRIRGAQAQFGNPAMMAGFLAGYSAEEPANLAIGP